MAIWMVRSGKYGEQEHAALESKVVAIGWNELPDLSSVQDQEGMADLYRRYHPDDSPRLVGNQAGQLWSFRSRIQIGDLVGVPLKTRSAIAVGRVTGNYQYRTDLAPNLLHVRSVEWIKADVPRASFDQDILYSFGALGTVCRISRNNAEERIKAVLAGKKTPIQSMDNSEESESAEVFDIEQAAQDQITSYIQQKFAGHELANLVDAVLQAEGYLTTVSPPGPDGGVDILAGAGPMGFGPPRLCVQVKSSSSPVDVNVLRGLQGILQNFHAEQGLLVSWGGFKSSVTNEARQGFFKIQLWDSGDLLRAVLSNYERFSKELQAKLPLKRISALVLEE